MRTATPRNSRSERTSGMDFRKSCGSGLHTGEGPSIVPRRATFRGRRLVLENRAVTGRSPTPTSAWSSHVLHAPDREAVGIGRKPSPDAMVEDDVGDLMTRQCLYTRWNLAGTTVETMTSKTTPSVRGRALTALPASDELGSGHQTFRQKMNVSLRRHRERASAPTRSVQPLFIGEFDPGSGRTLAACLTHASRTVRPSSEGTRVANG